VDHVETNSIISEQQHRFVQSLLSDIPTGSDGSVEKGKLDDGYRVDVVYLDYLEAFVLFFTREFLISWGEL